LAVKIGIFTNCYLPLVNGVVGVIHLLKKGFSEQGHQVYIFAPKYDDYADREDGIFRYPAVDLTRKVKFPVAIPFAPKINQTLRDIELDIIHSHHPFVLGPVSLKIARKKRIPAVYTFHTQYDQYAHYIPLPRILVREFTKYQIKKYCGSVDKITTPSESARKILQNYGVTRPVQVIPNPTDLNRFQNQDGTLIRKRYQLDRQKLLINIGRVAPEKNISFLLSSYQYILNHAPQGTTRLMIVGDGPDLANLSKQAQRLGIDRNVIFTGMVNPLDIPAYLAAADLLVMASTTEVKPMVQLEALAAGIPIVAVSAPGADDTVTHGKNGLLVRQEIAEFGEAVLELLFDMERQTRFREAARKAAADYSYSKIAGDYLGLYEKAIMDYQH
jgi:glycosyltransferase involved in cell wall biosynthesis